MSRCEVEKLPHGWSNFGESSTCHTLNRILLLSETGISTFPAWEIHSNSRIESSAASNKAAQLWQTGLIEELQELRCGVKAVSHVYDQLFPRGSVLPWGNASLSSRFDHARVPHLYLPLVRRWIISRNCSVLCDRLLEKKLMTTLSLIIHILGTSIARKGWNHVDCWSAIDDLLAQYESV